MTIDNEQLMTQTAAQNCISLTYPYYQQVVTYCPAELHIEAVDGGYVIKGVFQGKQSKTVALDASGLAAVVKAWAQQQSCKAK